MYILGISNKIFRDSGLLLVVMTNRQGAKLGK